MNFNEQIILEDERVKLTPLKWEDLDELENVAYEPSIWELGMSRIHDRQSLESYVLTALKEREQQLSYPFLIYDKLKNRVAGSTRFGSISIPNKRVEIGWTWIHPDFQGSGLNKHCKFLLLQYAFETLKLNRVELKTDLLNMQSRKAMLKIGAKEEGIFRKHQITSTGRVRDSIFFSIIDEEWPEIRKKILE